MNRRSLLVLAVLACAQAPIAFAAERPPLRNLLVELRRGDEASLAAQGGGLRSGAVVVGPDGRTTARAGVTAEARASERSADALQRLTVLNGAQGFIAVGASVPLVWYEVVWTPSGPGLIAGSSFVDTGRRVAVRPSWPGGDAPVTVEVRSEASGLATGGTPSRYAADGQPLPPGSVERAGLLTTLALPLGEWVTVAGEDERGQRSERGTLSTRELAGARRSIVQMRVSLP